MSAHGMARSQDVTTIEARTTATITLFIVAMWVLTILARPFSFWRFELVAAMAGLFVLALLVPWSRHFFALDMAPRRTAAAVAIAAAAAGLLELGWRWSGWMRPDGPLPATAGLTSGGRPGIGGQSGRVVTHGDAHPSRWCAAEAQGGDMTEPAAQATTSADDLACEFMGFRPRLLGIAYRMLGSAWDAEDVVAEAMVRWLHVDRPQVREAAGVPDHGRPRLALDQLRSARAQRESYVGPWLPEPMATEPSPLGPLDTVERRDGVAGHPADDGGADAGRAGGAGAARGVRPPARRDRRDPRHHRRALAPTCGGPGRG